jgi:hypothetical protein
MTKPPRPPLLRCPFCGKVPSGIPENRAAMAGQKVWSYVFCEHCFCRGPTIEMKFIGFDELDSHAAAAWNTRA